MAPHGLGNGTRNEPLENPRVHVGKLVNVQTGFAHLVPSQFCKEFVLSFNACHHVDADVALPGCEPRQAGVAFSSAFVPVVVAPEADNA